MTRLLATCAALAITAVFALPAPASAAQRSATGIEQTQSTDISAARRKYRRHYSRGYYGHRHYYSRPYYGYRSYGYDPYYRPYYARPGIGVGVGPFGFGFGF